GSLMIGAQFARCLSLVHSIPIITVDHLEAHLAAIYLENKEPLFPFLGVLLSGGNSSIYLVKNFGEMDLLGDTMDDALGEAFDKVSMILGLSYPGGPEIERRAGEYVPLNDEKRLFPELLKDLPVNKIQFSYSGIKTGVLYYSRKVSLKEREISKICYHFQNTAFQLVEKNIKRAVKKTGIRRVVAAGGVLANDTLKARLKKLAGKENIQISYPERKVLCTDNGAMVASLGYYLFQKQKIDKIDFKVSPNRQIYT
ncbi:MAG: tRNA (adenosine(37)-N6)-threonylcarbamoyltransferase complex transferase subunit TsaD, partial [Leptospiraceae bacterium]|nr:tRNA (adenosine(37)-N6)-threonylcarbamoyltransferase complex transferase subunit TsaD [Leptospiraceae bacterium]